jgi:hypothetical protein
MKEITKFKRNLWIFKAKKYEMETTQQTKDTTVVINKLMSEFTKFNK